MHLDEATTCVVLYYGVVSLGTFGHLTPVGQRWLTIEGNTALFVLSQRTNNTTEDVNSLMCSWCSRHPFVASRPMWVHKK